MTVKTFRKKKNPNAIPRPKTELIPDCLPEFIYYLSSLSLLTKIQVPCLLFVLEYGKLNLTFNFGFALFVFFT